MSPAVWSVDGVTACMLYSMVECRALGIHESIRGHVSMAFIVVSFNASSHL